jgi:hypothetical protein
MRLVNCLTCLPCALILTCAAGCSGDDQEEEGVDAEGCEHLEDGPASPVNAAPEAADASAVSNDHMRYDVGLLPLEGGDGNGGFVRFDSDEQSDFVVFLDAPVDLAVTTSDGDPVEIEESAARSDACATIRGRHVVALGVGTHYFELGPTEVEEVGLVLEETAHEDH